MNAQANKMIVEKYFELMNTGKPSDMLAYLSDDFLFESMLQKPEGFNASWDRTRFANVSADMASLMNGPFKIWIVSMTGEDHKVAVEAQSYGELKTGGTYQNAYHFLFKLRDGKIYNVREYSCSYTAAECFGGFFSENS